MAGNDDKRVAAEEDFHDTWAGDEDLAAINVLTMNESVTAPEMRHITRILGDLRGKRLLDIGSGLGEASVYFALKGARVTSVDISANMLDFARKLGSRYGVHIDTRKSEAEDLSLAPDETFDIVYAGNLFHHVDIDAALKKIVPHLKEDGMLVSWDPVAYNPLINVYRFIAKDVRTADEHPLRLGDIKLFRNYFDSVQVRYFWLTSLLIFIIMALCQFRNPNKERYWKKVVEEGDRWATIYRPLEKLDALLLRFFPFLGLLCWNVVICAGRPKSRSAAGS